MPFDLATAKPVESGFDLSTAKPVEDTKPAPTWGEALQAAPGAAVTEIGNAASSLWNEAKNLPHDPLGYQIGRAAAAVPKAVGGMVGGLVQQVRNLSPDTPEFRGTAPAMDTAPAKAVEDHFSPYTSLLSGDTGPLRSALATRPLGVATDVSTLAGVGALGTTGKLASALSKTSELTNPLSLVAKPIKAVAAGVKDAIVPDVAQTAQYINAVKADASKAYKAVNDSGMEIAQPSLKGLVDTIKTELNKMGLNEHTLGQAGAYTKLNGAIKSIESASSGPLSLQDLEMQRRIAGLASASADKTERSASYVIKDAIDDFVKNLSPNDVTSAAPLDKNAIASLSTARDAWARSAQAQQIQDTINKAANEATGGTSILSPNFEQKLRVKFKALANNDRAMARFTPETRASIKDVANGGNVVSARNILRGIGKFSPQSYLSGGGELLMGAHPGWEAPAAAIAATGLGARVGATSLSKDAANKALMTALKMKAPTAAATPSAAVLANALLSQNILNQQGQTQ